MRRVLSIAALGVALAPALEADASPEPGINIFHVAVDNDPLIGFGTYAGLDNPNYQRLTLVLSHTFVDNATINHFHRIGAYSYTGGLTNPVPGFSGNNAVPEPYQGDDGLSLLAGSGVFEGKMISGLGPVRFPNDEIEQEYGNTTIMPINNLYQYDNLPDPDGEYEFHPGHYLLNGLNGPAYNESVADVTVGLKLVGLSPGLTIHDDSGAIVMDAVDESVVLGPGADWAFEPVFAIDGSAPLGSTYEATFVFEDLSPSPVYGDSAEFTFSFIAVPEPTTALLGLVAMAGVVSRRR